MLVENLDFFKSILDDETIECYISLSNTEDNHVFNASIFATAQILKHTLKTAHNSNTNNNILFTINNLTYRINCLRGFYEKDSQIELLINLSKQNVQKEKKYLKLLSKSLDYTMHNLLNPITNNNISRIYLYYFTLLSLETEMLRYYEQQFQILNSANKGFSVQFPDNDFDIRKTTNNIDQIGPYIKSLKRK